ncbi:MAG: Uma2 family endonuclease [Firmicutes bacterium]|nr:Uma2 family endonuclease [Bacillota bacterium]
MKQSGKREPTDRLELKQDKGERNGELSCRIRETPYNYDANKIYTYDDYLKLPNEELYHYEILDGVLIKEPAPTTLHQRVSYRLQRLLGDYFWEKDPDGEIFSAPIDLTLSNTNVIQPDLVYIPGSSPIVEKQRINGIPELVVEIISPSTQSKDRITKAGIYSRLGVPHYWIVDPIEQTIEAFKLAGIGEYALASSAKGSDVFTHPDCPGLAIELAVLWRRGRL